MKIGIIVYSHTGNTLSVAVRLKEKLLASGHSAVVDQVTIVNDGERDAGKIQFKTSPGIDIYDGLVFGSPVIGASLHPAMAAYLSKASLMKTKKTVCFVTEAFPYPWMGGNRTIEQMKKICISKGVELTGTGVVNWSRKDRDKRIDDLVEKLSMLF